MKKMLVKILRKCMRKELILLKQFFSNSSTIKENLHFHNVKLQSKKIAKKNLPDEKNVLINLKLNKVLDLIKSINCDNQSVEYPKVSKCYKRNKFINHLNNSEHCIQDLLMSSNIKNLSYKCRHIHTQCTFDFSSISSFPLMNKSEPFYETEIDTLNCIKDHLQNLSGNSLMPSVTSILQKTMAKEQLHILNLWKQKMIRELGKEGFEKYQKELFAKGSSLHITITNYLTSTAKTDLEVKKENIGHWNSLKDILPHVSDVKVLEEFVTHPFLCYRGVVDCFAKYKDQFVVIDWKTSKKSKLAIESTYDNPLQIAAYVGALNFDPKYHSMANKGLIVIAYENGMPATTHFIDEKSMLKYWKEWLLRVKQFWELKVSEQRKS